MKMESQCMECLLSRVRYEAILTGCDDDTVFDVCKQSMETMCSAFEHTRWSARVATQVHRTAYSALGCDDPYVDIKKMCNSSAMRALPTAERVLSKVSSPFERFRTAMLIATIGNAFDFGVAGFEVPHEHFESELVRMCSKGFDVDDTSEMLPLLGDVVYLTDNCGEIVLDVLALRQLKEMGARLTLVVKGAPIITDATMEDVHALGLESRVDRVLTTGSNAIGVCLEEAPEELLHALDSASLVIAKGMANYESLSEYELSVPIAYFMMIKCDVVARSLGVQKDMLVALLRNG